MKYDKEKSYFKYSFHLFESGKSVDNKKQLFYFQILIILSFVLNFHPRIFPICSK
jgi:hypothetical protein